MKKTQLLILSLIIMPQAFAASLMVLPCDKMICTDYLKVDPCRLERCTFHLHGLKPVDKYFLIGEALLPTQPYEGREWLKSAATLGSVEAMFLLAQNDEQSGNMNSAWYWYEQAANNGHRLAQARLGDRYFYGQGTSVSIPDAIHWYSAAGDQGYLPAQVRLGDIYFDGIYCEQDFTQAAYWYHLGALQGDAHSAYQYGAMLSAGNGVAHDEKEAIKWLT
ncbi:MAG TPA: tetratricopeptide repeat protein, partial [Candidatus Berkiella sp.]|nr:tetratricopeptide repeat protein [Candidatus Berkiella sp.]